MGFFVLESLDLHRAAAVVAACRSVRSDHAVAGNAWVVVFVQDVSDGAIRVGSAGRNSDLFVCHRLSFWDSTNNIINGLSKWGHRSLTSKYRFPVLTASNAIRTGSNRGVGKSLRGNQPIDSIFSGSRVVGSPEKISAVNEIST